MYKDQYWYWELVVTFQKALMTGALVVIAPGTSAQIFVGILLVLFYMVWTLKAGPYVRDADDWMQFSGSLAILLTILCGLYIKTTEDELSSDDVQTQDIMLVSMFSVVPLLYIISFVILLTKDINRINTFKGNKTQVLPVDGERNSKNGNENGTKNDNDKNDKNDKNDTYDDWTDASDTSNVAKIMQDGQVDELYQRKALARQQTASHDHLEARLRAREKSHHSGNKTNENEPVAPVIPLEESTLWKQREEVKAAREAATAKSDGKKRTNKRTSFA